MSRVALALVTLLVGCTSDPTRDDALGLWPMPLPDPGDPEGPGEGDGDEATEDVPCAWELVFDAPGELFHVVEGDSALDLQPLAEGEGFYCLRFEADVVLPDNIDALPVEDEDCPTHLALASFFGSAAGGEYLATAFFRARDREQDACVDGPPRLEVGNYLNYTENEAVAWEAGQRYHVMLEARPWVTRLRLLTDDGVPVGPAVEAALWNASVEDTRDPVLRLGQNKVTGGVYFPWFGLRYENVQIRAAVASAVESP